MITIEHRIKEILNNKIYNKDNIFIFHLMEKSIKNISLENDSLVEFLSLFDRVNDLGDEYIYCIDFSKSLHWIMLFNLDELELLYDFLFYIQLRTSNDEKILFEENLNRAINDSKWLIDISFFEKNVLRELKNIQPLKKYEIINCYYLGENAKQEKYFVDLLNNRSWQDISQDLLLKFLQGGDFYFLSDKAYSFILPICIKLCVDMLKTGKYTHIPMEDVSLFLKRIDGIDGIYLNIKILVKEFIKLASSKNYYFFSLYDYDLDELVRIWN